MKKIIITTLISCVILLQQLHAQSLADFKKMPADQKAKMLADSLKPMLALSSTQYSQVYTVLLDGAMKATPIMNSDESRRSKRQKLTAIGDQVEAKLKQALTAPQYSLYENKKDKLISYYKEHFQTDKLVINVPE